MMPSRPILSVLILLLMNTVHSHKVCDLQDTDCLTKAANVVLRTFVPGVEGVVETSDPLYLPDFQKEIPGVIYKVINGSLSGMTSCHYTILKMNDNDFSYKWEILCDRLIVSHYFEADGIFGPLEFDGISFINITLNNYLIKFKGEYGIITSESDHDNHFTIKSSRTEFEPKGEVTVNALNELHTDKVKSDLCRKYLREHPYDVEKEIREPVLRKYMKIFINNLDTYMKAVPAEQVLPVKVQVAWDILPV